MTGLDEILSGTPTQEPPPSAPPPEPSVPRREPERRDPEPEPTQPGENDPSAPPAEEQEPDHVPVTALRDERRKRQEFERINQEYAQKIAQYEQMMRRQQQQPQPEPPPQQRPDLFTDPDGALEYVQRQFQAELERRDREASTKLLNRSVSTVMRQYPDYREAERDFITAVQHNPTLYDAMMNEPEPAEYAYRIGKQVQALREFGANPEAYRERVRQEEREAARKEFEEQLQQQQTSQGPRRSSIPPSLANARDTSGRFQPAWAGPTPLKDILSSR